MQIKPNKKEFYFTENALLNYFIYFAVLYFSFIY